MSCIALAVRPIDVAIFASLGLLWIFGALFIVALYRWIRRFEREQEPSGPDVVAHEAEPETRAPQRPTTRIPKRPPATPGIPHPAR